jgi:2',3'-cyclic-nucleotide 2'-phosphodiesterase (5'-nucleotidase family)
MLRAFSRSPRQLLPSAIALALAAWIALPAAASARDLCLTILHNNDGESQLLNAGVGLEDFGGAARFATVVRQQRKDGQRNGCAAFADPKELRNGVVMLSSGDNFLASPEFEASLEKGVPFFDSILLSLIRYDAIAIGNHEFDFGPEVLADFIEGVNPRIRFLSANLDLSGEPRLQALADEGRIAASRIVVKRGRPIGIVGATTPDLPFISSPRNVVAGEVLPAIQAEVDALSEAGVEIVILISHLQAVNEDLELIPQLRGVDVAIAGGGDELLANADDLLVPGDEAIVFGPYPLIA